MKLPCETVVWYVLPKIRAELAKSLLELGISQKEISKKLGVTQAAVSQYARGKRGRYMELGEDVSNDIKELAKCIAKNDLSEREVIFRICSICMKVKAKISSWYGIDECNMCKGDR
ncbi:MAG: putative transcriptional regulator [Candidatus Alkanophagales archaeon MCA70_species_1]|nr:putative transcriptional regulator [Candidatus Alkanophaga volatiphilum]